MGNGLRNQIDAADRFRSFAESGFLQLEHTVAALGTVGSQLMLVMSRAEDIGGPEALGAQIGHEVASLEGLLKALDRVDGSVSPASTSPLPPPVPPTVKNVSRATSPNPASASPDVDPPSPDRWLQ